jgi:predicted butyrate kinase (DUF1464 family)
MQIPRSHKEEVQRLAKQEQMSDSATGAALLAKAIQGNIDMKYGAMIKPVIEMTLERLVNQSIRHDIKRAGDLALEAFYS